MHNKARCCFCGERPQSIRSHDHVKEEKIKVGKQVRVIGFTNDPLAAIVSPSLTTIAEPAYEIGKKSCELLFNHMNKKRFQPLEIIIPGKLVRQRIYRQKFSRIFITGKMYNEDVVVKYLPE